MNKLTIRNTFSQLVLEDHPQVIDFLWGKLRFREKGYFHSRLYKQKIWDGYTEFFKKKTGRFPTGILPEVLEVLKHYGVQYEIDDRREEFDFGVSKVGLDFLQPHVDELRDYQVDLINATIEHRRGIVLAPTAAGKSFIIGGIVKALPPKCPTLILSNQTTLIRQIYDDLEKLKLPNIGMIQGKTFKPNFVTVSTVQSLHKIASLLPKVKALIVDEVHQNLSKRPKKYFDQMTGASVRVAVSATAFKFGGTDLVQKWSVKGYFGPVLTSESAGGVVTTSELQQRNILSASKCYFYPIREPSLPYAIYQDAITYGMAESLHFHDVVVRLANSLNGRTLIFVDRIALGDSLARRIPGALWVSGKDNEDTRKEVITQLKSAQGSVVAIATQQIFNAGINVMVHDVVNAAGGVAEHQIVQRMGRGLRVAGDKDLLNYHDFTFHINDYLLEHSRKRARILASEGHEVNVLDELPF